MNPLLGCSYGSRPSGVRVCPAAQFDFFSTAFDPREWALVVFCKEDSGRQLRLMTPENEGGDETSSPSPPRFTFFDDPDVPRGPSPPLGPPDSPGLPPGSPQLLHLLVGKEGQELKMYRVSDHDHDLNHRSPKLKPILMSDGDDDQSPQDEGQRQRSRSRDRVHPCAQAPQTPPVPPIQLVVIQEPATEPGEVLGSSGRQQRSRSRERALVHVPPSADEESAAMEPQGRVSDRSRSPQRKESPQRQKGKKTTAEVKKPSDLPKGKEAEAHGLRRRQ